MEARLKAIMEMDASDVQKELIKTTNELRKFERELAKSTDTNDIGRLTGRIRELNADMARLTQTANGAAKATAAVGAANKTAGVQSQNFARVIQDLPFGFMGIQNNLTQLIPGVGAAGLAFSALTAAITFSQVGLQYWGRSAKQAKEQADEFLEFSKKVNEEAGNEIVKAKLLYEASTNVALAMGKRVRAAKELKDLYPELLKGYSAEDIALGKAKDKYAELTTEIIKNARAKAAASKIGEIEGKILDEEQKIAKLRADAEKKKTQQTATVVTGTMGAPTKLISIQDKQLNIELKVKKEIAGVDKQIAEYRKQQAFYTSFAGGQNNLQGGNIPAPDKDKKGRTYGAVTQKDSALMADIARNNDFQQKKGKWWRESQTVSTGNTQIADPTVKQIEENATLNKILFERAQAQMMVNDQLAEMSEIAEYGGQVFGQMVAAMMNGESIGDVLANAFKQIAVQIAAAVAQALIFAALLEAFPALKGVFATTGALAGNGGGGGGLLGKIQGQDIQISQSRTSTGMGFRRRRKRQG